MNKYGLLAGILILIAYIPYSIETIYSDKKPNQASWLIWSLSNLTILTSYHAVGARSTIWLLLATTFGTFFITFLSLRYSQNKWSKFDKMCFGFTIFTILLWVITKNPFLVLILNLLINFVGFLPTIYKMYLKLGKESTLAWGFFFFSGIANILAIEKWTIDIALFPVYFLIINTITFSLSLRSR